MIGIVPEVVWLCQNMYWAPTNKRVLTTCCCVWQTHSNKFPEIIVISYENFYIIVLVFHALFIYFPIYKNRLFFVGKVYKSVSEMSTSVRWILVPVKTGDWVGWLVNAYTTPIFYAFLKLKHWQEWRLPIVQKSMHLYLARNWNWDLRMRVWLCAWIKVNVGVTHDWV
jgi:hypothetical protein